MKSFSVTVGLRALSLGLRVSKFEEPKIMVLWVFRGMKGIRV